MSDDRTGLLGRLLEAERQFHKLMPGRDIYSKLFFRTLFWFVLFSLVYTIISGV